MSLLTTKGGAEIFAGDARLHEILVYDKRGEARGLAGLLSVAEQLRMRNYERVYSLHRSYRTAFLLWKAGIPERIGFSDSCGRCLYTQRYPGRDPYRREHQVERNLRILDMKEEVTIPIQLPSPKVDSLSPEVRSLLESKEPYAVAAPGSVWRTKRWKTTHFVQYCRLHRERFPEEKLVLLGGAGDKDVLEKIASQVPVYALPHGTSLPDAIALIEHARSVVCNDSMILHVSSAFQVPTAAIFCATSPEMGFGPWENPHAHVLGAEHLNCRPCGRHGGQHCPIGTESCRSLPLPEQVFRSVEQCRAHKYGDAL